MTRGRGSKHRDAQKHIEVIKLHRQRPDLSQRQIASRLGISRSTVRSALDKVPKYKEEIALFRKQKPDLLAERQRLILSAINEKKVSEARLRDLAVAYGILHDKELNIHGPLPGGINIVDVAARAAELNARGGRRSRVRVGVEVMTNLQDDGEPNTPPPVEVPVEAPQDVDDGGLDDDT